MAPGVGVASSWDGVHRQLDPSAAWKQRSPVASILYGPPVDLRRQSHRDEYVPNIEGLAGTVIMGGGVMEWEGKETIHFSSKNGKGIGCLPSQIKRGIHLLACVGAPHIGRW